MIKNVLLIISALVYGFLFTNCSADHTEPNCIPLEGLYVLGAKSGIAPTKDITDLVFTGDDIISFGATTLMGEMVFSEEKVAEIISRVKRYSELHFFIDGKTVFSTPIKIYVGQDISIVDLDLLFHISDDNRIVLREAISFFLDILWVDENAMHEYQAKMQKRYKELDVLIDYINEREK